MLVYPYNDEENRLLFECCRTKNKRFWYRRPDGNGGHENDLNGVDRILFRLYELLKADPSKIVFITEGEKDVETLRAQGLIATTNPMGAGKWRSEFNEYLRDRNVVILSDNDSAGRDHAEYVANNLSGVAKSVKVIHLPGLPEKGDVTDWLEQGSSDEK